MKRKGNRNQLLKRLLILFTVLFLAVLTIRWRVLSNPAEVDESKATEDAFQNRSVLFNADWKFYLGDAEGGEQISYDDSSWETLDLPHDWSIETAFTETGEAESGFLTGGTGWYRKSFVLPAEDADKTVEIQFGGVYMNASVYLNGRLLGTHPYGYTSFSFDLSSDLICDGSTENVLAVKVENTQPNSRWYSGSGIYRDVTLSITNPVHIQNDSISVTYPDLQTQKDGAVDTVIEVSVQNDSSKAKKATVFQTIMDSDGNAVSESVQKTAEIPAGETVTFTETVSVSSVQLWSVDSPVLYTAETRVQTDDAAADRMETSFGYRYVTFDADHGFSLNGESMKIKGVCMHLDEGALGTAENESAMRRRILLLKEMGCNAVRTAHNPVSETFLKLCNELGMMVLEEAFDTWAYPKNDNTYDYSLFFNEPIGSDNEILNASADMTWAEFDIKSMVRQGRTNPSVILWSIGNEVLGNISGDTSMYPQYASDLCDWIQEEDTSRQITIGDNLSMKGDETQIAIDQAIADHGGVIGLNYAKDQDYDDLHEAHPDWVLFGSETAAAYSSRGIYSTYGIDETAHQITSYDTACISWGSTAQSAWKDVITRDYVCGEFIWSGFDYIGEPEPWNGLGTGSVTGSGPSPRSSYFGVLDTAGFEKDSYYFYQSQWNDSLTVLHILPCWNSSDIQMNKDGYVPVTVYSNAASVELFLNGESLGRQSFAVSTSDDGFSRQTCSDSYSLSWKVKWSEGTLSAKAYDSDGNEITETSGRNSVTTSGEAYSIVLSADRTVIDADGKDLSFITAEIQDENGVPVPDAAADIHFELSGSGIIVGTDNGDPTDTSGFQGTSDTAADRRTFSGKALLIVQSSEDPGTIHVTASSDGLISAEIQITSTSSD